MRPALGILFFDNDSKHLWSVMSDPDIDYQQVAIASFSTCRPGCREPTEYRIKPGEHAAITAESYIRHDYTKLVTGAWYERRLAARSIQVRPPSMSASLIVKAWHAIAASRETAIACKLLLADHMRILKQRRQASGDS
jgi:hypothetical protein